MELNELLELSVKENASDLHLSPKLPPMMRTDGDLQPVPNMDVLPPEETKRLILSAMSDDQREEFDKALELDFGVVVPNVAGFRVNAFHQINGVAGVFRVIPSKIPTLEELALPEVF